MVDRIQNSNTMAAYATNRLTTPKTLDRGSLAAGQPDTSTIDTRIADNPAATYKRAVTDLGPDVFTDEQGNRHYNSSQGNEVETRVVDPTDPPTTPLSRIDLSA